MSMTDLLERANENLETTQAELKKARKQKDQEAIAKYESNISFLKGYVCAMEDAMYEVKKAMGI